jgi:biopolymer transport protein ExbD
MSEFDAGSLVSERKRVTKPRSRWKAHVDLTPMVDVAFQLLMFFMVTTVFQRPLAMEINMPMPDAKVEVPESNVLSVLIDADGRIYSQLGAEALQPAAWETLEATFTTQTALNSDLIILVKIHRESRYDNMVEMMDLLEDAQMQRFSLVALGEQDLAKLEALR